MAREQSEQLAKDFYDEPVPADMRYGLTTIALLWVTMMTNFPMVLFGYEWYEAGFSLGQIISGAIIGCLIIFAFQMASGYMGAQSGLNYTLLLKRVFGIRGSKVVCAVWSLLFLLWYALNAVLISEAIRGLLGLKVDTIFLALPFCALMAINNWFNFRGVANFARYVAAPVLILWVLAALWKSLTVTTMATVFAPTHESFSYCLVVVPVLLIGNCMWGNEADFFRFSKSSKLATAIPLVISMLIGEILFPITGWLLGRISGAKDVAAFTKFMNDYTFGHATWLAVFVLIAAYFAVNDGNLYGAINGLENLWQSKRRHLVLALVLVSAGLSIILSRYANSLDVIATLNAVILACATMIVMFEYFLSARLFGSDTNSRFGKGSQASSEIIAPEWGKVALAALSLGWVVGLATSGIFPQLKQFNFSLWILYPWLTSFVAYGIGRFISSRNKNTRSAFSDPELDPVSLSLESHD